MIFFIFLSHAQLRDLDVFYFQQIPIDLYWCERIVKSDLNSSYSLIQIDFPMFFLNFLLNIPKNLLFSILGF